MNVILRRQIKFTPRQLSTGHSSGDAYVNGITGNGNTPVNGDGKTPRAISVPPTRQCAWRTVTQQDQDKEDNEKRKEALRDLVESWMDRLQLISVITTFFASTEASMLSISSPGSDGTPIRLIAQLANIGIVGSLIVHSSAAIISFLAAFFLVRYKLKIASNEEKEAEGHQDAAKHIVDSPTSMKSGLPHYQGPVDKDQEKAVDTSIARSSTARQYNSAPMEHPTDPIPGPYRVPSGSTKRSVWSSNPHLVQVGPFQSHPPTHLLRRCHTLCVILTTAGFVLALMGILCFTWDRLPLSVSVSASFFMALCILSGVFILFKPYPPEGTSPSIYIFDEF